MKDFFVSFNSADRAWADWIAWTLEEAGYQVVYQPWDFRAGGNFVLEMQKASSETRKTVVVLSDNYLQADYTQPEWAAAFVQDPRGESRVRRAPGMGAPVLGPGGSRRGAAACGAGAGAGERDRVWAAGAGGAVVGGGGWVELQASRPRPGFTPWATE